REKVRTSRGSLSMPDPLSPGHSMVNARPGGRRGQKSGVESSRKGFSLSPKREIALVRNFAPGKDDGRN
ncbi:hypothetical protein, partial [Methylosinus sp. 3S-1]|uniref:hypothetical protein n=1 Tax=Methylosinus sp. 3S-1 TaxID=1849840 RepID=UPI001AECA68C